MGWDAYGIVFYGVAYQRPFEDLGLAVPWEQPLYGASNVSSWYLAQLGLGTLGQGSAELQQRQHAALQALGVAVGWHGSRRFGDDTPNPSYIYIPASERKSEGDSPARIASWKKDPQWDIDLKKFFKLAGLPFSKKDVGWWVINKGGHY